MILISFSTDFIQSIYNGLEMDGVFVAQVGESPDYNDPPDHLSTFYNRAAMLKKLEQSGFQRIHTYDEVGTTSLLFAG